MRLTPTDNHINEQRVTGREPRNTVLGKNCLCEAICAQCFIARPLTRSQHSNDFGRVLNIPRQPQPGLQLPREIALRVEQGSDRGSRVYDQLYVALRLLECANSSAAVQISSPKASSLSSLGLIDSSSTSISRFTVA